MSNPARSGGFAAFSLGCSQTGFQICGLQQIFIGDYVQSHEKKTCFQHMKIACSRFYM
ncbi:unnamed protein product [Arabidopsis lyrata]|uniref:Predicted protein n=1 Tax=Arabidopsis lyrata subsp. lyrata TaxID=81972 RepID=D7KUD6_ARALL|nr:predicted protein [Arabidopsis lyrata subsp. lyrata]EFH63333.1 predicted protein [Arabidopsis lyrata subsp. lyrata]CAH8257257.1 unnamed protein product [Arabidopsis lyrata]CAH8262297.1 unnamed protein product [Arabidopsis lyrata]